VIGRLTGTLSLNGNDVIVDTGGVGYTVSVSEKTRRSLFSDGDEHKARQVTLEIATCVKEDAIVLVGFTDPGEKQLFHLFKGVSGIGTKTALAILSFYSPEEIARAISINDTAGIQKIPGIGRKMAERLVVELRDKISKLPLAAGARDGRPTDHRMAQEALSALVNLGYTRFIAEKKSLKAIAP
jgi:holliday junction DNA helicase RuvA